MTDINYTPVTFGEINSQKFKNLVTRYNLKVELIKGKHIYFKIFNDTFIYNIDKNKIRFAGEKIWYGKPVSFIDAQLIKNGANPKQYKEIERINNNKAKDLSNFDRGKYKGHSIESVLKLDYDYVVWFLTKCSDSINSERLLLMQEKFKNFKRL